MSGSGGKRDAVPFMKRESRGRTNAAALKKRLSGLGLAKMDSAGARDWVEPSKGGVGFARKRDESTPRNGGVRSVVLAT